MLSNGGLISSSAPRCGEDRRANHLHIGGRFVCARESRRPEEQCLEVRGLTENVPGRIDPKELGGKRGPCEITVQAVLNPPGRGLVSEIEAEATPHMTDEVMDGTKAINAPPNSQSSKG